MFKLGTILIAGLTLLGVAAQAAPVQWAGNGHYYDLVKAGKVSWDDARFQAETMTHQGVSGHLATVTSAGEWDFLKSQVNTRRRSAWLGGSDNVTEGVWKWMAGPEKGQTFYVHKGADVGGFTAWNPREPNDYRGNEDYLAGWSYGRNWNDMPGKHGSVRYFVVEYSALPAPSASPAAIPVPAALPLLLGAMGGLALVRRFGRR